MGAKQRNTTATAGNGPVPKAKGPYTPLDDTPLDDTPLVEVTGANPKPSGSMTESRTGTIFRFIFATALSLVSAAFLNTVAAAYTGHELAGVSRTLNQNWEAIAAVSWKVLELGTMWAMGYDHLDIFSLTLLSHLPHAFLLHTFYEIPILPLAVPLGITLIAHTIPVWLFRARNPSHVPTAPQALVHDGPLRLTTAILGATTYILPLYASLTSWLPVHLATDFAGLHTLSPAHDATFPSLLLSSLLLLPIGFAAREFLFSPIVHPAATALAPVHTAFVPRDASFTETLEHNVFFWRTWKPRTVTLFKRTAVLTALTFSNTAFLAWVQIDGAEPQGAIVWASVWAAGALAAGLVLGWVGEAL